MQKKEIDYSKTIIYRIMCKNPQITDCYIGHTTDFTKRKATHKHSCNTPNNKKYNYNIYKFIRQNGNWDNWSMIKLMDFSCNNVYEASKQERICLEQYNATLNTNVPSQSHQEWKKKNYEENKAEILEYNHIWKENNKVAITEYNRKYYEKNKEKINEKKQKKYEENKNKNIEL